MLIICCLAFLALDFASGAKIPPPPPGPSTPVFQDECKDAALNDCPPASICIDQFYGFSCQCKPGYVDKSPDKDNPGRLCVLATSDNGGENGQQEIQGNETTTVVPTSRKHKAKGSKSTGKTEPPKSEVTKSPLDQLARDAVSPKPKSHHRSKPKNNSTVTEEKPKEKPKEEPENEASKAALRDTFTFFDANQDGKIDFKELQAATKALNQKLADARLREMLAAADTDGDGLVNFSEFRALMKGQPAPSS